MKSVVITGATGTIGMALINKCIEQGIEVIALVNPESRRLARIPDSPLVKVIKCGLDDFASADATLLGVRPDMDALFHLAWGGTFGDARNNKDLQDQNAAYASDAVRLAHRLGCKVFVGAGSQAECGRVSGKLSADTPCDPENEYGRAKLAASKDTRDLCRELGMRHIWPRILSIYGPYDGERTMVISVIRTLLQGGRPALTKGEQMWDYLYSEDAATALLLLAEKGTDGRVYPIGSGTARPLREYIEIIRDEIDPKLPLGFGEIPYSPKQVMHLCADITELTKDTGFNPQVSFEEGAGKTIAYVRGHF
ncbi:MAG: NAD(P)-dependent oxidoreductase [Lachnospiraceae bacterium]|nr:NAD(P)-dependent oxidoreductase [Lachnospiraceae bacterium]